MNKGQFLTIAVTVLFSMNAFSQENGSALDPVSVTASMHAQKTSHTGRDVLVVKGEQIASLPIHSIDELLRYLPGIEVQSRGPMGAQSDIVMRGGTFQQVLVILDGLRLNDPNTGHFTAYIPIAPAEIERIEILKGASSAMYGSEAVGGIIQIITKSFAARKEEKASAFSAGMAGGSYGLFNVDAGGYYSSQGTTISGGILSNNTNGQLQRGIHGYVHAHTASVSLSQYLNKNWQLQVRSSYDQRRFAAQNFYTSFLSDTASEKVISLWNQLGVRYTGIKHHVAFQAGYKALQDEYRFNSISTANQNHSRLIQAMASDEWNISARTTLVSGLQYIRKSIRSNDRGDHDLSLAAAFLTANFSPAAHFYAAPALRLEWHEIYGWQLVPQVNLSWRISRFQLRGSAGKTLRDADFTERYNNYQKSFVSGGAIGNPDLTAERSFSYEAGADYFLKDLKLSATFFRRNQNDLIDYVTTPYDKMPRKDNLSPTGSYTLAMNIAHVNTSGIETAVQYIGELAANRSLQIMGGASWLWSESDGKQPSLYLSSHAHFLANLGVRYHDRRWAVSANGLYKQRRSSLNTPANIVGLAPHYLVINAKAEAFFMQEKLSLFAEVDNIFDERYADLLGALMPGRWIMGGIRITLNK